MMVFEYLVSVEVERVEGKFASRDEIAEQIQEALDDAESNVDVSGIGADGDSEYEVQSWTVDEQERTTRKGTPKPKATKAGMDDRTIASYLTGFQNRGYLTGWRKDGTGPWMIETSGGKTLMTTAEIVPWLKGATLVELHHNPIRL